MMVNMRTKKTTEYAKGEIGKMVSVLAQEYGFDVHEAANMLKREFPALCKKDRCANCGSSMKMTEYKVDVLDARLLIEMGNIVRDRVASQWPFTLANKIKVQEIKTLTLAERCRTSQCRFLGLIAKVRDAKTGAHDQEAGWLITERGFAFLRNEEVPLRVLTWHNEIQDRFPERTTIAKVLGERYVASDWYELGITQQGSLL